MRSELLALGLLLLPAVAFSAPHQEKPARRVTKKKANAQAQPRCRDIFCKAQVLRLDGSTAEVKGLTEEQVEEVMQNKRERLEPCLIEVRRRDPNKKQVRVEFVVSGAGRVLAVRVDGKRTSPLAKCVSKQMTGIHFPTSTRPRMMAAVTLAMPE